MTGRYHQNCPTCTCVDRDPRPPCEHGHKYLSDCKVCSDGEGDLMFSICTVHILSHPIDQPCPRCKRPTTGDEDRLARKQV